MAITEGLVIGLHLFSAHLPSVEGQNNINPGIYVSYEGATAGCYYNTLRRTSCYLGYSLNLVESSFASVDLMLGVVNGYKEKVVSIPCGDRFPGLVDCWEYEGSTKSTWAPMLVPSIRFKEVLGVVPRVSYIPSIPSQRENTRRTSNVFHLSLEKTF